MASDSETLTTGKAFDVFLAHNSADKALVTELAEQLRKREVSCFLDMQSIEPGEVWQTSLARGLSESRSCAVCIGPAGLGPWTREETHVAIDRSVRSPSFTVIPVLLPGAKSLSEYAVSAFLPQRQSVDFRSGFTDNGLDRLAKVILSTGKADVLVTSETELRVTPAQDRARHTANAQRSDSDRILEKAHSQEALNELARLRQIPHIPAQAREDIRLLADRIQEGDLQHASSSAKAQVLQVAARRHAVAETLDLAQSFREALQQVDPTASTVITDALISRAKGDIDVALRSLRDINEPGAHDTFFVIINEVHGDAFSVEWYESQEGRNDPDFFTGQGWCNLAVTLANLERWDDASKYLAHTAKHRSEYADFSYIEGVVNQALLLPSEYRHLSLMTNLFPPHSLEGSDADQRREHAIACFNEAEKLFSTLMPERAFAARERSLWLRLTHASPEERKKAATEIEEELRGKNLSRAISLIPLAILFQIPFNSDHFWHQLELRAKIGGLDNRELHALYELARTRMNPQEFFLFLEKEEPRLTQLFPSERIIVDKLLALARSEQTARARAQLEQSRSEIEEGTYRRISVILDEQEGKDPRVELERLYKSTKSLVDIHNLANHLFKVKDWKALEAVS